MINSKIFREEIVKFQYFREENEKFENFQGDKFEKCNSNLKISKKKTRNQQIFR